MEKKIFQELKIKEIYWKKIKKQNCISEVKQIDYNMNFDS